jgi:pilus assembly protein CpaC
MNPRGLFLILSAIACTLAPARAAIAQSESGRSGARVELSTQGGASRQLALPLGKSAVVDLPTDVRDILVTNPAVADAVLRNPRKVFVLGQKTGVTDVVLFDAAGRRVLSLNVRVDQDVSAVAQTINRVLPGAQVKIDAINDTLILSGQVANLADADRAFQIAKASVSTPADQTGARVLNMITIAGKDQVMLKVRIVEMQRNVIKQLGFNLSAVMNQLGEPQYLLGTAATFGVNGALLGGISAGYKLDTTKQPEVLVPCLGPGWAAGDKCPVVARAANSGVSNANTATIKDTAGSPGLNQAESTIKAFERVGLVRTLAEPNLTAVSGESAKFLAGGEYPIPVAQDAQGRITVDYKPFGVGLGFTPVVLSSGRISLKISTEVSELTSTGAFTLNGSSTSAGLTIPALNVRRVETSVELPSGGALMIAGLLKEETKQNLDGLPGMTTLPVLGALFRSRDYLSGETELVVIVTPYIVQPTSPDKLQTPADGMKIADDASTILMGELTKAYKAKPQPKGRAYEGPYGYVIE